MNTVSIIDADPMITSFLREAIDASGRYSCVSAYEDPASARRGLLIDQPGIVIFEPRLPDETGIESIRWLKSRMARTEFLAFTRHDDAKTVFNAVSAGATGYLCKRSGPEQLIRALDDLSSGGSPLSATVARLILEAFSGDHRAAVPFPATLTRRESEVLAEIVKGRMLKEITSTLGISQGTLNTHMRKLYRKLEVNSRCEIMARYFSSNLRACNPPLRILPPALPGLEPESAFQLRQTPTKKII